MPGALGGHPQADGAETGAGHRLRGQPHLARDHGRDRGADHVQVGARVQQGGQEHVAGDPGRGVDPGQPHARNR
ncbi:hypothetical protein FHS43_005488 [Streptosporangium becharense]|uniref:Uncharacterized protein n=1 Tax=Streptosporangium becharense TaxID=1816182 RepID=A0A7W9IAQ2_9ACTN|nr:hypothetical protein [Streptosporangium becharense]MBB2914176.1 hypothetical protein [Streptosporangium becharense]MBB5817203.1 hypothetical protein [Streptosporangium becharense]